MLSEPTDIQSTIALACHSGETITQMESQLIAERIYYLDGQGENPVVHLQMYGPTASLNDYPECSYILIVKGEKKESKRITSVDTIGCISLCLIVAGTEIAGLNDSLFEGKLRWDGWQGGNDIGLPIMKTTPETRVDFTNW